MPCLQPWMSDAEESPFLDPALRKRAVKVKHVKRREKKSEKKVMERVKWVLKEEDGTGREMETEPDIWSGEQTKSEADRCGTLTCHVLPSRRRRDINGIDRSRNIKTSGNIRRGLTPRTLHLYRSAWGLAVCAPPSLGPSIVQMTVA